MADNLELFNKVREVPDEAKKTITGGRLNGMTDVSPIWRIQKLTEEFGICGIGWYYEILNKQIIEGANDEKIAIVDIALFVKINGEWSKPIYGTGGSSFVAKEKSGYYTSDECYKMALTDALSVSCKALGFGADVYYGKNDGSKYENKTNYDNKKITDKQVKRLYAIVKGKETLGNAVLKKYGYKKAEEIKMSDYDKICEEIEEGE